MFNKARISIPLIKGKEILFFTSYLFYLSFMLFYASFFAIYINNSWKIVFLCCITILIIYEISTNRVSTDNTIYIILSLILILTVITVGQGNAQNSIAALVIYVYCSRNISLRKTLYYSMIVSIIVLCIVIISAYMGIIPNYEIIGTRHREYLGFRYALYPSAIISNIILIWMYLKKGSLKYRDIAIPLLINAFFYYKTDSRLSFYLTSAFLVIGVFVDKHPHFLKEKTKTCWIIVLSFIECSLFSLYITLTYNSSVKWKKWLNSFLGQRLIMGQRSLFRIGVKLFGITGIQWVGNGLDIYGKRNANAYLYVDNYYVQVMQRFGIVFLVVIIAFLTYATYKAYRMDDYLLLIILLSIALRFIIDDLYMYIYYNSFWFAAGKLTMTKLTSLGNNKKSSSLILTDVKRSGKVF